MGTSDNENTGKTKTKGSFLSDTLDRAKKALETTSSKAEKTGRQALKLTEEFAESFTSKAEAAVEATVKKIKEIRYADEETETSPSSAKSLQLKPREGMTVEQQLSTVGDEIAAYLEKNGPATLDKIANVMKRRKNSQLMIVGAIGWLIHAGTVQIGADNTTLATKQEKTKS